MVVVDKYQSEVPIAGPLGGEPTIADVTWLRVDSSNVHSVGWDGAGNMYVRFSSSGSTYVYLGVSRQRVVAAAYLTSSIGSYINKHIKPYFDVLKLG